MQCCSLLTEGVTERWTSAFGSVEVPECRGLNAVLQVCGIQLLKHQHGLGAIGFGAL